MIDFERAPGRVSIRGIRYLLIQPATLVGFQKAAEAEGGDAASWLEAGGRAGGRRSSSKLRELRGLDGRVLAEEYLAMGGDIGWGVFRVTRYVDRRFEVEVTNSPFAEAYGRASAPVCHFTRGVIAGLGETLFGAAECDEVACAAGGAAECRFVCLASS